MILTVDFVRTPGWVAAYFRDTVSVVGQPHVWAQFGSTDDEAAKALYQHAAGVTVYHTATDQLVTVPAAT